MIWNSYLIDLESYDGTVWDVLDHFNEIDRKLFDTMISGQLFKSKLEEQDGYFKEIEIQPNFGPLGCRTMWANSEGTTFEWKEIQLTNDNNLFQFIEFFDWTTEYTMEHQYVKARMVESIEYKDLINKDFLFETWDVKFLKK
ncbi:hypothetical protein [Tenacibaculum sp. M341]|uniref:hypothetical protein n=1 Tax=Tenacibaculum sp. M341 TaxID=2530339 RepID=UPI001042EF99|nr:hypothetical protein [Tenacibaculum sp. M341]TCI90944.1 hypothetical protein EYW44_11355 [Tenacibaculum sp. M341]